MCNTTDSLLATVVMTLSNEGGEGPCRATDMSLLLGPIISSAPVGASSTVYRIVGSGSEFHVGPTSAPNPLSPHTLPTSTHRAHFQSPKPNSLDVA
jgi:hypothetical protein